MNGLDVRRVGDAAVIVGRAAAAAAEHGFDPSAIAAATRLRDARLTGVRDVVAAATSLAVFFDPRQVDVEAIVAEIERASETPATEEDAAPAEIPVEYGGEAGPDLDEVALASGLSAEAVIERHAAVDYRVLMVGFLPGWAYLGPLDPAIVARRRSTPRVKVPPGSVAVAGGRTGIYPQESPGGWQIIGRTTARPFDVSRTPPALFAAGELVRFVPVPRGSLGSFDESWRIRSALSPQTPGPRGITVVQPGLMTTVQDEGRWGHQHEGVPVSGAMDVRALRDANRAVGNPPGAGVLEATLAGLEVRVEQATTVAVAGADLGATVDGRPVPLERAVACGAGSIIGLRRRDQGARAYLAFDGGIDVPLCLGSRATDMTSGLGGLDGRRLRAGDRLPLGARTGGAVDRTARHDVHRPVPSGGARVRVLPGPHGRWFPAAALEVLARTRFEVTAASNRMGYRLRAGTRIPREDGELLSEPTCHGAIQVPPSGEPILLMADRQVTGGYPIVAVVITADLPVAGQLAPGDWIEFEVCGADDAARALAEEEPRAAGR